MPRALASAFTVCVVLALASRGQPAHADTIDACVSAATAGQDLQRAGKLRDARAKFLSCDKRECPAEVRSVCDRLLNAVEASLPTVILGARDAAGADLVAVRVLLDGAALVESLDGKALTLDPGPHTLRFERPGSAPIEQKVVILEAEKNRAVVVTFPATSPPPEAPTPSTHRPVPLLAYILGGVGMASLGAFTVLTIDGQSRYDSCNPGRCAQSTVDSLNLERYLAFGALGVGVVSLGVATWLFVSRPAVTPRASVRLGIGGTRDGAVFQAATTF